MLDNQRVDRKKLKVLLRQLDEMVQIGMKDPNIDAEGRSFLVETNQFVYDLKKALRRKPYEEVILEYAPTLMHILERAEVPFTLDI